MISPDNLRDSQEFDKSVLNFQINYSPHTTVGDFDFLRNKLRSGQYQIYVPEANGRTPEFEATLISISKGDSKKFEDLISRTNPESGSYAEFKALYGSRSNLFFADTTAADERTDPDLARFGNEISSVDKYTTESFMQSILERVAFGARVMTKRDTTIAENLMNGLPPYIRQHPRLRNRTEVNVLITIGDNHRLLPVLLEAAGYRVNLEGVPEVYTPREEAMISILLGKQIDDKSLAEVAATALIRDSLKHPYTQKMRVGLLAIVSGMTEADIAIILEVSKQHGLAGLHQYIEQRLADTGYNDPDLELVDPKEKMKPVIEPKVKLKNLGSMAIERRTVF